jgi:hypothetical protein
LFGAGTILGLVVLTTLCGDSSVDVREQTYPRTPAGLTFKRETIDLFMRIGVNIFVKGLKGDIQRVRSSNHEVMVVTETIEEKENDDNQSENSQRANVEVLSKIGQSNHLQEKENDDSQSENSELNSDKSDTYDLGHTGMC